MIRPSGNYSQLCVRLGKTLFGVQHHLGVHRYSLVKFNDLFIDQAGTAIGNGHANSAWIVGAVNTQKCIALLFGE